MAELSVLCVGSATLDTIAVVDHYPAEDSRAEAHTIVTAGGGPAATAAVAIARLGVSVGFCGRVADDDAGRSLRDELEREGVDVTWLRMDGSRTASSVVLVGGSGSRTIVTLPGDPLDPDGIPVGTAQWIHVDQAGYAPTRAALGTSPGHRLSIDHGNPIDPLDLHGVALYAPTVQRLRDRFPGRSTDEVIADAHAQGAESIVATAGDRGAWFSGPHGGGHTPAMRAPILSTLGAGDVFHGALLAELVRGADLESAVTAAAMTAALSCRALDGRSAIPRRRELDDALAALNDEEGAHVTSGN